MREEHEAGALGHDGAVRAHVPLLDSLFKSEFKVAELRVASVDCPIEARRALVRHAHEELRVSVRIRSRRLGHMCDGRVQHARRRRGKTGTGRDGDPSRRTT